MRGSRAVRGAGTRTALLAIMLASLWALSGCGSKHTVANRISGKTLTIYSSMPLHGASNISSEAIIGGAEMALAQVHGRVGKYRIVLRSLDDSTAKRGTWDPVQTTANAHTAADDNSAIGYIGELNSGASAISIPVLNRAGIPQISPTSTAVGLTSGAVGAAPGEPAKYYPTRIRTFARVIPNDAVEAAAQVRLQKSCRMHQDLRARRRRVRRGGRRRQLPVRGQGRASEARRRAGVRPAGQGLPLAGRGGGQDRGQLRADQRDHRGQRGAADQAGRRRAAGGDVVRDRGAGREHVRRPEARGDPAARSTRG